MAPTAPAEDVNFPDLLDKILEPLLTLVSELFITLWTYMSDLVDYVVSHPIIGTPILAIGFVVLTVGFNVPKEHILHCLDIFQKRGVLHGPGPNGPNNYQSTSYGGNVRHGSTQSQGAKGGVGLRSASIDGMGPSSSRR